MNRKSNAPTLAAARGHGTIHRRGPTALVMSWVIAAAMPVAAQDGGDNVPPEPQPKVIKQGGYVEKVEPGVDYGDRLPRHAPKSPPDSQQAMHLIKGFRVELVAAEPLIADPVDFAFDENGRLYVAELITYSESRETRAGRVSRLEDRDGDGYFESKTVFVDGLEWPTAVLCFDGGVFVASTPDVLYCKDTDGDGRADEREIVLTGFVAGHPNQCPNSFHWNLDNRIELMPSGGGGLVESVRYNRLHPDSPRSPVQVRGRDVSMEPRTGAIRLESGGAQYGMAIDDWGRKYESSNSAPIQMVVYEDRYVARNPFLAAPSSRVPIWADGLTVYRTSPVEPWRVVRTEMRVRGVFSGPVEGGGRPDGYFTSACGLTIYNGGAWPSGFQGNAFVCEGASNLVHRMRLEPDGVLMKARRTETKHEFWTSDEIWFKPVQLGIGPDGGLYLADMYREVFEHPDAVPPSVKKYVDLNAGNDRGRIWRVVPEGFTRPAAVRVGDCSTAELVSLLAHPNAWHRITASRLLYERQDQAAVALLRRLADESPSPLARVHELSALTGLSGLSGNDVLKRLGDDHPRVREHAIRLAERVLDDDPAVRAQLTVMADDPDMRVRWQLAFTLGQLPGAAATRALADVARRDPADRWVQLAVLSSSYNRAGELLDVLLDDQTWRRRSDVPSLLERLAYQAGRQAKQDQVADVLRWLEQLEDDEQSLAQRLVKGLSRGLSEAKSPLLARVTEESDSRAGELLDDLLATARRTALDPSRSVDARTEATRLMAMAPFADARSVLGQLIDGRQPQEIQMAALRTLARFENPDVAQLIVDGWRGYTPAVRGEAAEALLARKERLQTLFEAVRSGAIPISQLDPARLKWLQDHPDGAIREEAQRLFGTTQLARREDAVKAYQGALQMQGDVEQGRAVFKRECATCHRLENVGYDLGLPLQNVKSRGPEGILAQILDPNREVNPTYLNYVVITVDGRVMTGAITAETATSITLTRAEGEQDIVLRRDIEEMRSTELSVMPEGLEEKITLEEMADLIAYLMVVAQ